MKTKKSQNIQIGFLLLPGILILILYHLSNRKIIYHKLFSNGILALCLIRSSSGLPTIKRF